MAAASYCFPVQSFSGLVTILQSWELDCVENDFKQPKRQRWQPLYTSMLAFALGTDENDTSNNLLQTQFDAIQDLEYPKIHEEAMPLFNLCRAMQRVLYTCGVEDFNIRDIVEPKPRRLQRICSALLNFINFRSERLFVYDEMKIEDDNRRNQREVLIADNEDKQKKINAIKSARAQQEPNVQAIQAKIQESTQGANENRLASTQIQRDTADMKALQAEKKAQLSRITEQIAAAKEEGAKLSGQIVQSPERLKGEMDRMQSNLSNMQMVRKDKYAKLVDLEAKFNSMDQQIDNVDQALGLMKAIHDKVQKEKEMTLEINKIRDEKAKAEQMLRDINNREQAAKRMIVSMQGKLNKQHLQHQNKIADLQDKLSRLEQEKERLESERGQAEDHLREAFEARAMLEKQDAQHAQNFQNQLDVMKAKYKDILLQVDIYHNILGKKFESTQQQISAERKGTS